jgi:hypothetical protein
LKVYDLRDIEKYLTLKERGRETDDIKRRE